MALRRVTQIGDDPMSDSGSGYPRVDAAGSEELWQAVLARDRSRDGAFVFGVRSTGIYCRPSCPARHPRREQVAFFHRPDDAEAAGFRACRRCHPRQANGDARAEWIARACRHLEAHADERLTLAALGAAVGVSPAHLQRTFKQTLGITPRQYADACRLNRLKAYLKEGQDVTMALYEAGYGSSSRLYEKAPAQLGMTPATYRRGGRAMRLRYTIVDSRLGRLLVAATERGISAVYLGDADAELEEALRVEYPDARIERDAGGLGEWVQALLRHLAGQQPDLDLPLDVRATAFQRRVWEALQAIPAGSTYTYGEIARSLGHPGAARAVGRACATNPVSLVIPCHRAVRQDGSLAGYRWGVERKRALIEQERGRKEPSE
jgi:AraC family transcriptional regulator, regulatory protein of adaptative response / methylated-DNA-[protein]-cysteine methyltransferase